MTGHRKGDFEKKDIPWQAMGEFSRVFSWKFFTAVFAIEALITLLNITETPSVTIDRLFDIDVESNFPTWFSSAQLLLLSLTTLVAWKLDIEKGWNRAGWLLLASLFGYLSIDETATIHESFGAAATKQFHWTLWGEYSWLLLFAPLACMGLFLLIRIFWRKLRADRRAFVWAGVGILAWTGTLVIETTGYWLMGHGQKETTAYRSLVILEELCEMAGTTFFWMAIVRWIRSRCILNREMSI